MKDLKSRGQSICAHVLSQVQIINGNSKNKYTCWQWKSKKRLVLLYFETFLKQFGFFWGVSSSSSVFTPSVKDLFRMTAGDRQGIGNIFRTVHQIGSLQNDWLEKPFWFTDKLIKKHACTLYTSPLQSNKQAFTWRITSVCLATYYVTDSVSVWLHRWKVPKSIPNPF